MKTVKIFLLPMTIALLAACTDNSKPKDSEKMADKANDPKTETVRSENDAEMLVDAVSTDYFEIAAADEAKAMATHADVRDFAMKMSQMHTMMLNETVALANKKSFTVPSMMGNAYLSDIENMRKWAKGEEFDTKYIDAQVDLHQKVLDKLERTVANTQDTDIKMWAEKAAAEVRTHIEMARAIDNKLDVAYK